MSAHRKTCKMMKNGHWLMMELRLWKGFSCLLCLKYRSFQVPFCEPHRSSVLWIWISMVSIVSTSYEIPSDSHCWKPQYFFLALFVSVDGNSVFLPHMEMHHWDNLNHPLAPSAPLTWSTSLHLFCFLCSYCPRVLFPTVTNALSSNEQSRQSWT